MITSFISMKRHLVRFFHDASTFVFVALISFSGTAHSIERIKEVAMISGVRTNPLVGYGLVVGLDGTGDQTTQAPFTGQSVRSLLETLGVSLPPGTSQLRNVAAVLVTADLPPSVRPGQRIDITISSIGNSRSLRGGTLIMTPLRAADGQIYAIAQGNIIVSGFGASTSKASTVVNHLSVGRIPDGAIIERAVPPPSGPLDLVTLELRRSDFALAQAVTDAVNLAFGPETAVPVDSRAVNVRTPADPGRRVGFLARLEALQIGATRDAARVVVNARTGSVVMNQTVTITNCAIAHGGLTVKINKEPIVSQPNSFSQGTTVETSKDTIEITQVESALTEVKAGANLSDVVRAINLLGANPQDLIAILQAMKTAGALKADLEVI
jgi:flagellar P-ring protein precursor FlgI